MSILQLSGGSILRLIRLFGIYLLLLFGAVLFTAPFLWMLSTSLKTPELVFTHPPQFIPNPVQFRNYMEGWQRLPFTRFTLNTVIITSHNAIMDTLVSAVVGFSFARLRAPGKDYLFVLVLATMMVPYEVTRVPLYILFSRLGWVNTLLPLMNPTWFGWPFFIFLLRQFFTTIPFDLDDAARIDGASNFGIYWRVVLPLSKPALAAVAIFMFNGSWNDFFGPLIYLHSRDKYTIALGLRSFQDQNYTEWHLLMAASLVAMLPVVLIFFFAQKYFIQGIVFTGVKG